MRALVGKAEISAGRLPCRAAGDGPRLMLANGWPRSSFRWHRIIRDPARTQRADASLALLNGSAPLEAPVRLVPVPDRLPG